MKHFLLAVALIACQTNAHAFKNLPREFQMLPPMAVSAVCSYRMLVAAERLHTIESRSHEIAKILVRFSTVTVFWAERAVAQGARAKDFEYWIEVAESIAFERVIEQDKYCFGAGENLIEAMPEAQLIAFGERVADYFIKRMK